ncbi:hypothetical protein ZIOFF_053529 [Zingiber officinale]|uniref:Uncharacterized protein n=1 Tax=Zingiber officinale TaxID=94328 RepID=A0A8J5KLY3_ZINOF|nr:hypothetical protein ZIOFF_053529 [Zingiber officinale]
MRSFTFASPATRCLRTTVRYQIYRRVTPSLALIHTIVLERIPMQALFRPNPNRTPPHRGESKREISPCWHPVGSALLCFRLSSPSDWFAEMEALGQSRSDGVAALYSTVEFLVAESVMVAERFLLSLLLPIAVRMMQKVLIVNEKSFRCLQLILIYQWKCFPKRKVFQGLLVGLSVACFVTYGETYSKMPDSWWDYCQVKLPLQGKSQKQFMGRGKHKAVPENKDDGESDDEGDDNEDEDGDEQEDDGGEDDVSGEDDDNDAYDDPQANGEGGSEDEDDEDDDDDDDEEDDDGDEDDEDEEEDEELQQPPSKKRK